MTPDEMERMKALDWAIAEARALSNLSNSRARQAEFLRYHEALKGLRGLKDVAKRMADELARMMATVIDPQEFCDINALLSDYQALPSPTAKEDADCTCCANSWEEHTGNCVYAKIIHKPEPKGAKGK